MRFKILSVMPMGVMTLGYLRVRLNLADAKVAADAQDSRGDLAKAVQQLKREPGKGLFVGGVKLVLSLTELGLIDEYEFIVHPRLAGKPRR